MGSTTSTAGSPGSVSSQDIIKALTPNGQNSPAQKQDAGAALNRLRAAQTMDKAIDGGQASYQCTGKDNGLKLTGLNMKGLNPQQKSELQSAFNTLSSGPPLRDKER